MPLVPDTPVAGAGAHPPLTTRGLKPTDINPDDMDDVTMRIFTELKRQLELLEKTEQRELKDPATREKHARILASLERTMERLALVEAGRAAARKSTASNQDGTAVDAFKREISRVTTVEFARRSSRSAQE